MCARSQESLQLGEVLKEDATTQNLKQEAEFTACLSKGELTYKAQGLSKAEG